MKAFLKKVYGIDVVHVKLLRDLENKSYFVEGKDQNYLFRVCNPHFVKKLEGEIKFLKHLSQHRLKVPRVISTLEGLDYTSFDDHIVVLFKWIEGQPIGNMVAYIDAENVGRLMKDMHNIPNLELKTCPIYDHEWLYGEDSWFRTEGFVFFNRKDFNEINHILNLAYQLMKDQTLRVIHSDVHFGNVVKDKHQYAFIDFDGYAMSSIYFDLGVTFLELLDFDDEGYIEAFFKGYGSIDSNLLNAYVVAGCMVFIEWVLTSKSQRVKEEKLQYISQTLETLKEYGKRLSLM